MRKPEWMEFTDTVRLHDTYNEGVDFRLEVRLASSRQNALLQARSGSVEDLRCILGDYLFEAMETSNWRKEEKKKAISYNTGAFKIFLPDSDGSSDCKMEVVLGYWIGIDIWHNVFPILA